MRFWKLTIPTAIAAMGLFISFVPTSSAKPAYAKAEKKSCTFCHVKAGQKDLNAAGTYYKDHNHSLEGYKP